MPENRKRTAVDHPAHIHSDGRSIGCSVANISADGAAIELENPHHVPDRFQLVTEHGRVVLNWPNSLDQAEPNWCGVRIGM